MIEASEIIISILAIAATVQTLVFRKDLEEHGLHLWVYAGAPLFCISALVLTFWDEMSTDMAELLTYSLTTIAMATIMLGAVLAYLRRR